MLSDRVQNLGLDMCHATTFVVHGQLFGFDEALGPVEIGDLEQRDRVVLSIRVFPDMEVADARGLSHRFVFFEHL